MVLFAFSLQDQVEKYGAYVAIGCFFGLAVLSLLYFAQARELRRLRDWAGRSPEFEWDELERRVLTLESRRAAAPQRVAPPVPAAAAAVASNGAHKLKPEQVAALAFARAAGVAEPPHPPKPAAAPVPQPAAVAVQDPPQTAVEAAPPPPAPGSAPEPVSTPATGNGNGSGHGEVPPLTPAARAMPAQPLRRPAPTPAPARRMPAGPPARRETSVRSIILMVLLGLVVVGGVAFGAIKLLGGGDDGKPVPPNRVVSAGSTDGEPADSGGDNGSGTKKAPATPPRAERTVMVLNGTGSEGLAGDMKDRLVTAGYTDNKVSAGNVPPGTGTVTTSVVFYKRGAGTQARDVARVLDISTDQVKPIDATLQTTAKDNSVVVEIGQDKSGN
jgi:LytR cell envelope-related transcriptional attenuator